MKKKYKVYLDTNAFSGLLNTDTPGNKETIEFIFKMAKNNKIELYFSDVLLTELNNTKDKKIKDYFVNIFKNTPHVDLQTSKKDIEISNLIVERFILKKENFYDALHIACAISNKCDFIISWNFHMIKTNRVYSYKEISKVFMGYEIEIVNPQFLADLLRGGNDD